MGRRGRREFNCRLGFVKNWLEARGYHRTEMDGNLNTMEILTSDKEIRERFLDKIYVIIRSILSYFVLSKYKRKRKKFVIIS